MNSTRIRFDVYDPSNAVSGGYWQMGDVFHKEIRSEWQSIANLVCQGFPIHKQDLILTDAQRQTELWGCIRRYDSFWVYRLFHGGRDNFGRPGRYFFIMFKVNSPSLLRTNLVNVLVGYLEKQISIPIDLQPLKGLSEAEDSEIPRMFPELAKLLVERPIIGTLSKKISAIQEGSHAGWIIYGIGETPEQVTFQLPDSILDESVGLEPVLTDVLRELDQRVSMIEINLSSGKRPKAPCYTIPQPVQLLLIITIVALGIGIGSMLLSLHRVEAHLKSIDSRLTSVENANALRQQSFHPNSDSNECIDSMISPGAHSEAGEPFLTL